MREEELLTPHQYDGIREFDHPAPGWTLIIFAGSVLFSIGYAGYYHLGSGQSDASRYTAEFKLYNDAKLLRSAAETSSVTEVSLASAMSNGAILEIGQKAFLAKCAACHTENGRGNIGPNLTDAYQLHGSSRLDIFNVVRHGIKGTAMMAWSEQMQPAEVLAASVFVMKMRGTNIAGKEQQGVPVVEFTNP